MPINIARPRLAARLHFALGMVLIAGALSACGPKPASGIHDPMETTNRAIFEFNRSLDRSAVRPSANTYGKVVPGPVRQGIQNFALNLGGPGFVANNFLQFRLEDAVLNTVRFAVNSTVGLGGILDPATAMGIPDARTNFGETLAVWGFGEGAFVVLPIAGPSTVRDSGRHRGRHCL